ncbi:hypothetical protein DKX38_021994 [Salix brachista]|uniref:Uncharacterized protein n=1 Tax=Salix brachista TaxID=2182728 RepID=A0A5N5K479_9ROSI|nr:hypothetical protein DKX38_021994 [Salix brachista]
MSVILAHGLSPPLIEVMMAVVLEGTHSVLPNSNQYILWFPPSPPTNQKPLSTLPGKSKRHRTRLTKAAAETREIRVCTNRTCRKQGSFQTLEVVTDLAPPDITVKSSGCLGRCGSGPNVAILPQGIIVNHCGTAAKAAQFMATAASVSDGDISKSLEALALRKTAQAESDLANFSKAEELLSLAIDLQPFGGIHVIYKYRSLARLAMRNYSGALEDAREALRLAPRYLDAYMCEGDVFMAMEEYDAAEKAYLTCLQIDPSIRRSKSFKMMS